MSVNVLEIYLQNIFANVQMISFLSHHMDL